ncbi:MAG: trypsin-like peptidase domain-containing protein [Patulibacter sp.]
MSKLATPVVIGVSAVLGAGLAIGVGALGVVEQDGTTTTVVQQAPLANPTTAPGDRSDGEGQLLTARAIYERDAPGVVQVLAEVRQPAQTPFGAPPQQGQGQGQASGSGFVIDDKGTILTNHHVINGATSVQVAFGKEKTIDAKIIGQDPSTDIAVLRVDPKQVKLRALPLGSAAALKVGDPVVAIGNPFGLDRTLTTGVVSAKQRQLQAPNGWAIDNVIQTDASINPGNSGGPLIDGGGRVVGINSQIATGGGGAGSVGIGFAVPIDTVKKILPDLEKNGRASTPYLGVVSIDVPEKDSLPSELSVPTAKGAWVQTVTPGSPAAKAGIRGGKVTLDSSDGPIRFGGDVITKVDDTETRTAADVAKAIVGKKAGDEVKVELLRGKERKTITVKLERRPDSAQGQQQPGGGAPAPGTP